MINYDLLDKALTAIENEPARWNQHTWAGPEGAGSLTGDEHEAPEAEVCGTTMCLAGHAMVLSGQYEIAYRKAWENFDTERTAQYDLWFRDTETKTWVVSALSTAQDLLNLDYDLAYRLFIDSNSLTDDGMNPDEFRIWVKQQIADHEGKTETVNLPDSGDEDVPF